MAKAIGTKVQDIEMVRGDTLEFVVEVKNTSGTVSAVSFGCRQSLDSSYYAFQKTLGSGITAGTGGKYTVRVAPADTATRTAGLYYYDLQFTIGSDVYTPLIGTLRLLQDVTHT